MNRFSVGLVLALLLLAGSVSAQEESTDIGIAPGSPFFFLERILERVGDTFTFGEEAKARRAAEIAEKRLRQAEALAERDEEASRRAMELFERRAEEARRRAEASGDEELKSRIEEARARHIQVLERVLNQVPEQARPAIERVLERSRERMVDSPMPVPGMEGVREMEVRREVRREVREGDDEVRERVEDARETREFESLRPQAMPQRPAPAR